MPLTTADLRKLADDVEARDKGEADAELRAEIARLKAKVEGATPAERHDAFGDLSEEEEEEVRRALTAFRSRPKDDPEPDPDPGPDPDSKPPKVKKRPGRKSGNAYDWDVDDDGNRVERDTVVVWSDGDEDDEVEVPAEAEGW